jgi:protein O-GlcNAc transferase
MAKLSLSKALKRASALESDGRVREALNIYQDILIKFPKHVIANQSRMRILNCVNERSEQEVCDALVDLFHKKQFNQVLQGASKLVKESPTNFTAWALLGSSYLSKKDFENAVYAFSKACMLQPNNPQCLNNFGVALLENQDLEKAVEAFSAALSAEPNFISALYNLAKTKRALRKNNDAIKYYKRAAQLEPSLQEAYIGMAASYFEQNDYEKTSEALTQALLIDPNDWNAYSSKAQLALKLGDLPQALESFNRAIALNKQSDNLLAKSFHLRASLCDFSVFNEFKSISDTLGIEGDAVPPFTLLFAEDNPTNHRIRSENYIKSRFGTKKRNIRKPPQNRPKKIHIGYFSGEFENHPVSRLIIRMLELHDKQRFKISAFAHNKVAKDSMGSRITKALDQIIHINQNSDDEVVKLLEEQKVDIAIDLSGHTLSSRLGVFAKSQVPIQINFLGYPGTMGAHFIDYIVADKNLIPLDAQKHYIEKPIYMPSVYQPQDDSIVVSERAPSRKSLKLPENTFVFCAINNSYKIEPVVFNSWMSILKFCPKSVLWLLSTNKFVKENLTREAIERNVDPARLIFSERVSYEDYILRFKAADLFLDTFIYNAGATASDALKAGLPVLTKQGNGYSSRMASSLLNSLNLYELITTTTENYISQAVHLAQTPEKLLKIKNKLNENMKNSCALNSQNYTEQFEHALELLYSSYLNS